MLRKIFSILLVTILVSIPISSWAQSKSSEDVKKADLFVVRALKQAQQAKLTDAKSTYQQFNDTWLNIEDGVKAESGKAYTDIEANMGQVLYAFTINNQAEVIKALTALQTTNENFIQGKYPQEKLQTTNISLADFVSNLKQTKTKVDQHSRQEAIASMSQVTKSWLSVEGSVVARSSVVYSDTERDMVTVSAMLTANPPNYQSASKLLGNMIHYLSPLATTTGYTIWDAAMIPIREGLEALLVVASLLAFVKKSNEGKAKAKGKGWIWLGVASGLLLSIVVAVIVKFVFSSGAFGNNNFLISGWTGVIAAAMLLYMSYWLHSQSNIRDWNKFLSRKSQTAMDTGRLVSLGVLSFLAIFREGTETVLFLIGMVNQISIQNLITGLLIGLGILVVIAYLMLVVGLKLPLRPFFMVSSLIVFYLCIKFTGMGIHSLQLAGVLPSTNIAKVPSIELFAIYPSLESIVPQVLLLLGAIVVIWWKRSTAKMETGV